MDPMTTDLDDLPEFDQQVLLRMFIQCNMGSCNNLQLLGRLRRFIEVAGGWDRFIKLVQQLAPTDGSQQASGPARPGAAVASGGEAPTNQESRFLSILCHPLMLAAMAAVPHPVVRTIGVAAAAYCEGRSTAGGAMGAIRGGLQQLAATGAASALPAVALALIGLARRHGALPAGRGQPAAAAVVQRSTVQNLLEGWEASPDARAALPLPPLSDDADENLAAWIAASSGSGNQGRAFFPEGVTPTSEPTASDVGDLVAGILE